jgi:hypothetical protein
MSKTNGSPSTGTKLRLLSRSAIHYIFIPFWAVMTPILRWLYIFIQVLIQWGFKPVCFHYYNHKSLILDACIGTPSSRMGTQESPRKDRSHWSRTLWYIFRSVREPLRTLSLLHLIRIYSHSVAHGFEVVIFEADSKVGGIWANVNSTSALQLNSILYRFHPAVIWSQGYPPRDEILGQIRKIWKEYQLEPRTRFNVCLFYVST